MRQSARHAKETSIMPVVGLQKSSAGKSFSVAAAMETKKEEYWREQERAKLKEAEDEVKAKHERWLHLLGSLSTGIPN